MHTAAFGTAGAGTGPAAVAEARLVDALRTEGAVVPGLSVVAVVDDRVVGHVVCSRGSVDGQPLAGLGPLGVLPAQQGRGVGHALLLSARAAAARPAHPQPRSL